MRSRKCSPLPSLLSTGSNQLGRVRSLRSSRRYRFRGMTIFALDLQRKLYHIEPPRARLPLKLFQTLTDLSEQESISAFAEFISNFGELPRIIGEAIVIIGIDGTTKSDSSTRAFAGNILSVEIKGPLRPQLTLVDLPGIIRNNSKDATKEDIKLVKAITHPYFS